MKFSPVLAFALSSLLTSSLAAPLALRQPAPRSAPEPVDRRSSPTGLIPLAAPAAPDLESSNFDHILDFGMGTPLSSVPNKEKRSDNEKRYTTNEASAMIGFGTGETLGPVRMSSLAIRDDPLIRRKVAELAAVIKERVPEASIHDVLIREASPTADVVAPAA